MKDTPPVRVCFGAFELDLKAGELRLAEAGGGNRVVLPEHALAGKREEAVKILHSLEKERTQEYVHPWMIASVYTALGEKDQAIAWLEKSYEERDDWIVWTRMYQGFDSLRSEVRFQDLLRRIGLAP